MARGTIACVAMLQFARRLLPWAAECSACGRKGIIVPSFGDASHRVGRPVILVQSRGTSQVHFAGTSVECYQCALEPVRNRPSHACCKSPAHWFADLLRFAAPSGCYLKVMYHPC